MEQKLNNIKIILYKEKPAYNDQIYIPFTPNELSYIIYKCNNEKKSDCKSCGNNKLLNIKILKYLEDILQEWRKGRNG